jgi:predicted transcriptional regulator
MSTQLQIPDEISQRFEELAQYFGQSREQVMLEILEAYLAQVGAEAERITQARAQIAHGKGIDAEEIKAEDEALLARLGVTPEQLAVIDEEVCREAEAFYSISLCE